MTTNTRKRIVILGGGTAGWMAATLMAKAWSQSQVEISVIESPDIGIIGVGEGSTPQLKAFFDQIGVEESQWMAQCHATYKHGISFRNWSISPGFESYFHAFPATTDRDTANAFIYNCHLRRLGLNAPVAPQDYFLPAYLAAQKSSPLASDNFPFPVLYGYHFDAYKVGEFLRSIATDLGVRHIQDKISEVRLDDRGAIAQLIGEQETAYAGDYFVDATGFSSVLLQQTLGVEFESFADSLFNDAAVVLPTEITQAPQAQTVATAMSSGWRWDIPLTHRTGNGYVYASAFCSQDEAETELRSALGLMDSDVAARHLKMKVGQVAQHWHKNCVAVGLSQGFLEPLEATALHLVQATIEGFIDALSRGDFSDQFQTDFNTSIKNRFAGVRDYIVCHYKVNTRDDNDYWRANRNNPSISDSLRQLLEVWHAGGDLTREIERQGIAEYYSSLSWHSLLAGYGVFPEPKPGLNQDARLGKYPLADIVEFNRRCALNFAAQKEQLGLF